LVPGGVGIFLQPPRDGTMERFVRLCEESGYFSVEMWEDYNPEVISFPSDVMRYSDPCMHVCNGLGRAVQL
jgi:hypothetical protein